MAAALHRSTTVTPEMLAAAHLDQPQTLTIPHTAYAAVNSVSTYRAQYPTRQPTIPLHTAFNRSVSDTDTSWAKKQKARVLAEFQITGEVDKSEVLEGYAGAKGILQPNGWLEVLHGSTDSSISLRPESFLGATIWCEISYHDFRAMSLNSIAQGMVEQIADPDLPVAVAQARLAIGVRRVAEARKALATSARLLKELWAAALTMQRDPYAGSKMEPGLCKHCYKTCDAHYQRLLDWSLVQRLMPTALLFASSEMPYQIIKFDMANTLGFRRGSSGLHDSGT